MTREVKLSKRLLPFIICYCLIVISDLIAVSNEAYSSFRYFTKPSILGALIVFFLSYSSKLDKATIRIMMLALIFSWIGDVLLLFTEKSPFYFMAGLASFLMAHLMYVVVFFKKKNMRKKKLFFFFFTIIYGVSFLYVLQEGLGEMLIPVIAYMIVILLMSNMSYQRAEQVSKSSYWFVFVGSLFFMLSDSLLAITMFYMPLSYGTILVMTSYAIAQFLIVYGILQQKTPT